MFPSLPLSREGEAGRRTQDGDAMCCVLGALSPLQVTFSPLETMRQTFSGQSPPRKRTRTEGSGWACAACTFVNEENEEVCVCDTPRRASGFGAGPAAAAASAFGSAPGHVEHGNVTGPEEKAAAEPAADELAAPAGPGPSPSAAAQQVRLRQERRNARETQTKQALRDQANLPDVLIGIVRAYHCPELDCKSEPIRGHPHAVLSVAVVDEQRVVSGSLDKTLKLWDLRSGRCMQTLSGHTESVIAVAVVDEQRVVSGSCDNTLKVWTES